MNILVIIMVILIALVATFMLCVKVRSQMIGNGEIGEITLEQIKTMSPNFIYIHGMVASGKTTLSNTISTPESDVSDPGGVSAAGYKAIHIDDLVRDEFPVWPKDIYTDAPDNQLTPDQLKLFERIKNEMANHSKIVVDGFIAPLMWKELYKYRPWDMLIFVKHKNAESYRLAIMKRAIYDLDHNMRTLSSFWRDSRASEMIEEYKKLGKDSPLLQQMVTNTSIHKWDSLEEKSKYWTGLFDKNKWPWYVYYTDLRDF